MERPDFYALSVYQRLKGKMTRLLEPVLQGGGSPCSRAMCCSCWTAAAG